jgi:hypothetical protein
MKQRKKQRPDVQDVRPKDALFQSAGQTGWLGRRDISGHKKGKKEGDFHHLHEKFTEEEA